MAHFVSSNPRSLCCSQYDWVFVQTNLLITSTAVSSEYMFFSVDLLFLKRNCVCVCVWVIYYVAK